MGSRLILLLFLFLTGCSQQQSPPQTVPLISIPESALNAARHKFPEADFTRAWKTTSGNYLLRGQTKKGKTRKVQVTPDGEVIDFE